MKREEAIERELKSREGFGDYCDDMEIEHHYPYWIIWSRALEWVLK